MSPGARGELLTDRPAPGRRDVAPPKPPYGYPPPYYPGLAAAQANTWLGAPLISMANNRRGGKPFIARDDNKRRDEVFVGRQIHLSKMAMQAQGAPLIIQGRYGNQRKFTPTPDSRGYKKPDGKSFVAYDRCDIKSDNNFVRNVTTASHGGRSANMDAVSVTSDESSGSANSEVALPRIIKPRKRRKKDRKPTNLTGPHEIVSRKHDVNEDIGEPRSPAHGTVYPVALYDDASSPITNCRGDATVLYHSESKIIDYSDGLLKSYTFGGLTIADGVDPIRYGRTVACEAPESVASVCQCRYCDPSGQIWDIDSVGFSELFDENSTVDFAPTKLEDSMKVVGSNSKKANEVKERDTTLRRSWSDPSSSHSNINRNIGEETCMASADSLSSTPDLLYSLFSSPPLTSRAGGLFERSIRPTDDDPSSYRLVPDLKLDARLSSPSVNLEVSSEIVTSLNGHRDLEIKFFSTSPPATASKVDYFFAESHFKSVTNKCKSENINEPSEMINETDEKPAKVENKLKSETVSEVT